MPQSSLVLERCSREEYAMLAKYCGTVTESKSIVMKDGVQIGSRSNNYFYVSPVAFKVAFGRQLSGKQTKNRSLGEKVL